MTVAAISVTVASLAGIGIMVGVLPGPPGQEFESSSTAAASAPITSAAAAAFATTLRSATPAAPPPCHDCGTVESVRAVVNAGKGIGLTASMNDANATAGRRIDRGQTRLIQHEIAVRLDDGTVHVVTAESQPSWHAGERVKLVDGAVLPM
jgi:hypothetical protein